MLRRLNSRRKEKGILKIISTVNGKTVVTKIDPKKNYYDEMSPKKNQSINKNKKMKKVEVTMNTHENIEVIDWMSENTLTDSEGSFSVENFSNSDTYLSDEPIDLNENVFRKRVYKERSAQKRGGDNFGHWTLKHK